MRIDNKLIRGDIRILKTDADTGSPLQGAKFGLYDLDGKLIAEDITGEDGYAAFLNIPYGDYEIKEISAPDGYQKTDEVFKVSITENGATVELTATNTEIPKTPDNPKTGDDSNMTLWLVLLGASAVSLVGLTVAGKRRKTRKGA
jgi:uncharacterized surface anchored protein